MVRSVAPRSRGIALEAQKEAIMAGRGPQSFKKRQKEQQRKERQQEKMARRLQRKHQAQAGSEQDQDQDQNQEQEPVEHSEPVSDSFSSSS